MNQTTALIKVSYNDLSSIVCATEGCKTRIKRNVVMKKADAKGNVPTKLRCYRDDCLARGKNYRARKNNRDNNNRRIDVDARRTAELQSRRAKGAR